MNNKTTFYESPEVKVVDILAEGVLCSSQGSSSEGFEFGDSWEDWEI
jgi:hypothetical protein